MLSIYPIRRQNASPIHCRQGNCHMSEDLIIDLMNEYLNRTWSIMQFWVSVSFGMIAVSHLAAKHLNWTMAVIISVLYSAFTVFVISILGVNERVVDGFMTDLATKHEAGTLITKGALNVLQSDPSGLQIMSITVAFMGTFFGTLLFLWYSFVKNRPQPVADIDEKDDIA